jgi:hypothetical protein
MSRRQFLVTVLTLFEASESDRKMGGNTQIIIKPDWKKERKYEQEWRKQKEVVTKKSGRHKKEKGFPRRTLKACLHIA